ncbi:MAG: hypothetical protein C0402_14155, partial [Thermodesulfovibrio sp.]|nr:hypothetical protein [Thermodesulfovibrio sp.]
MVRCTCGYEAIGIEEELDGEPPMSASDVTIETDIKSQSTEEPSKPVDTEPVDDIAAKEPRISVSKDRRKTAVRSQLVEEPIESVHLESYNNVSVSIIKQYPRGKFTIYCKGSQTYMESAVNAFKHNSSVYVTV